MNIVTWASDTEGYRQKAEQLIRDLGNLFVSEVISPEPVEARRDKIGGGFEEEIEDMIARARDNPNAIIYGTFHTFDRDDA